ncbi:MAG: hypothetical protein ITG07_02170 [Candidimonas sp.]|nr:hypothetical protein [Candidimonas sp.]
MNTVNYKGRIFKAPSEYEYYIGEEDSLKYTVIPVNLSAINPGHDFISSIVDNILFVRDISSKDGVALAFPAIDTKKIAGTNIVLLSKEDGKQYPCRDNCLDR